MARKVRIELVLDAKGVVKGVRTLDGEFDDLDKSVKKTGKSLSTFKKVLGAAFLAVAARQVARFAARMFELGSAVEETGSKFNTVFAEATESVDDFGESFANMAGLTKKEFQDIASVTGSILQGLGADLETSARDTERALRLAGDLASFNNVSIQEAFTAVRSGIIGESEPLRRYGIIVTEAKTKLEALNATGKSSEKQLTQLEKAQARLNIIFRNAGKAVGDLERTQGSAANEAKAFNAVIREQEELLATALLPALNEVRKSFSEFVLENRGDVEDSIGFIGRFASATVRALGVVFSASSRFFDKWQAGIQLTLANVERSLAQVLRLTAGALFLIENAVGVLGISVPVLNDLAKGAQNAAGFLDEVVDERMRRAAEALGVSFEKAAGGVDKLTSALGGEPTGETGDGKKGLKGVVESLNEEIAKLAFHVRDLTNADAAELRVLIAKVKELEKELFFRKQLVGLIGGPTEPEKVPGAPPGDIGDVARTPDDALRVLTGRIEKQEALTEAVKATEAAERASHEAAIARAVAIGAAQTNVLQAVLASVRQIIQARLAEAIAGATASSSILGPIAAAAAGALMAILFNRLMPSGFKDNTTGGGQTTRAETTGSTGAALGGIRVQDRGFTTGALGAARSARAPEMTIRVVGPDLFKLNVELKNADGVRAQVGNL